ncbi:MAG TPA: response regulator, partial [Rhodospirillaceae bacterium]|nr:response regulator [Rhodospirillaceae bacterium]
GGQQEGAAVTFETPTTEETPKGGRADVKALSGFEFWNFLIVDDADHVGLDAQIRTILRSAGAQTIHEARDGGQALKMLERIRFDAIICPCNTAPMDGLELVRRIRAGTDSETPPSTAVVMPVNPGDLDRFPEAREQGNIGFIERPVSGEILLACVRKVLGGQQEGAAVTFETPTTEETPKGGRTDAKFLSGFEFWKFLIVDDADRVGLALQIGTILRSAGAQAIEEAPDGAQASKMLEQTPFDVIICPWNMAPMDGLEFVRRIRAGEEAETPSSIPIIMITGSVDFNRVPEARKEGAIGFVAKPIEGESLISRIRKVFEQQRDAQRPSEAERPLLIRQWASPDSSGGRKRESAADAGDGEFLAPETVESSPADATPDQAPVPGEEGPAAVTAPKDASLPPQETPLIAEDRTEPREAREPVPPGPPGETRVLAKKSPRERTDPEPMPASVPPSSLFQSSTSKERGDVFGAEKPAPTPKEAGNVVFLPWGTGRMPSNFAPPSARANGAPGADTAAPDAQQAPPPPPAPPAAPAAQAPPPPEPQAVPAAQAPPPPEPQAPPAAQAPPPPVPPAAPAAQAPPPPAPPAVPLTNGLIPSGPAPSPAELAKKSAVTQETLLAALLKPSK